VKVSIQSQDYIGAAHNPAAAGSLVQIQPPQPILSTAVAYRVYVIQNREGKFYIGVSDDAARRVEQHNSGQSRWTKGRGPWTIVWQSDDLSLSEARKLENRLKRQKGGHGLFHLVGVRPSSGS